MWKFSRRTATNNFCIGVSENKNSFPSSFDGDWLKRKISSHEIERCFDRRWTDTSKKKKKAKLVSDKASVFSLVVLPQKEQIKMLRYSFSSLPKGGWREAFWIASNTIQKSDHVVDINESIFNKYRVVRLLQAHPVRRRNSAAEQEFWGNISVSIRWQKFRRIWEKKVLAQFLESTTKSNCLPSHCECTTCHCLEENALLNILSLKWEVRKQCRKFGADASCGTCASSFR